MLPSDHAVDWFVGHLHIVSAEHVVQRQRVAFHALPTYALVPSVGTGALAPTSPSLSRSLALSHPCLSLVV